jgi:hypothetical protein
VRETAAAGRIDARDVEVLVFFARPAGMRTASATLPDTDATDGAA